MWHLLASGQPAMPGIRVMLTTLDKVVTVVLAQSAEPACSRELGRLAFQGVQVAGLQVFHCAWARLVLLWPLPHGLNCSFLAHLVLCVPLSPEDRRQGAGGVVFYGDDAASIGVHLCLLSHVLIRYPVMLRHRRHHPSKGPQRPKARGAHISQGEFSSWGCPPQRRATIVRTNGSLWNLTPKVEAQEALYVCLNVLWIHSCCSF